MTHEASGIHTIDHTHTRHESTPTRTYAMLNGEAFYSSTSASYARSLEVCGDADVDVVDVHSSHALDAPHVDGLDEDS